MARKPHNYVHFQNLVNELKEQNINNVAGLQSHLEVQTDVLQSMKGLMLQGVQLENEDLKRDRDKNGKAKPSNSFLGIEKQLESQTVVLKEMSKFFNTKLPDVLLKETEPEKEQTSILSRMLGFWRKKEKDDIKRDKENRLEGGVFDKKKKWDLPKGLRAGGGKGFMGMLGNFLSTALLGIPGGLRRFLPRSLGMAMLPKLARGVAAVVAGPALIEALQAGFNQNTFTGGVTAFIDSYFSEGSEGYNSLASAAMGTAGKGALIGFALGGPKGAIMAGILSGVLGGLNHMFTEDKSKMDSGAVMKKMKKHLLENLETYVGIGAGIMGAKAGLAIGGLPGMIAGGILGAGIGMIGSGTIREMIKVEEGGEKDLGVAFREGLKNYYMKIDWGSGAGAAGAGALFFAGIGSTFGPHGMFAGALLGSAVGLLGGPILSEALRIDQKEGKGMADAMKKATWNYIKTQAKNPYVTSALAGATAGGILGSVGTLPGMIAGTIIGAIFGVILQW